MLNDILKIIPTVDKNGYFRTWAWSILINNIGIDDPQPCNYSPELEGEISESSPPPEPPPFQSPPLNSSLPRSPSHRISPPSKT